MDTSAAGVNAIHRFVDAIHHFVAASLFLL